MGVSETGLNTSILDNTVDLKMQTEEAPMEEGKVKSGKRKRKHKKAKTELDEDDDVLKKNPRKKRSLKPEPVYDIPDVERKETTFRGRLGLQFLVQRMK
jgi:UV DNA damage endonuclease